MEIKEEDIVFIKNNLIPGKTYGITKFLPGMVKGVFVLIKQVRCNGQFFIADNPYVYDSEMIDTSFTPRVICMHAPFSSTVNVKVYGAELPEYYDMRRLSSYVRTFKNDWWCKLDSRCALIDTHGSFITDSTNEIFKREHSVRPIIIGDFENFKTGNVLQYKDLSFMVLSQHHALCMGDIGLSQYSEETPNTPYNKSDLYSLIQEWFDYFIK